MGSDTPYLMHSPDKNLPMGGHSLHEDVRNLEWCSQEQIETLFASRWKQITPWCIPTMWNIMQVQIDYMQ